MIGYQYVVREGGRETRQDYWSAFRLAPGTRIVVDERALVVESTEARGEDYVAFCRVADDA